MFSDIEPTISSKCEADVDENLEVKRTHIPSFPNTLAYVIDDIKALAYFGSRYHALDDTPEYKEILATRDVHSVAPEKLRFMKQNCKQWLDLRSKQRATGSVMYKLCGLADYGKNTLKTADMMEDLIPQMYNTADFNDAWDMILLGNTMGHIPSYPLDDWGPINADYGKKKENNAVYCLMDALATAEVFECGVYVLTNQMLQRIKAYDVFDPNKAPLTTESIGIEVAITPDFKARVPVKVERKVDNTIVSSVETKMVAGEIKTPTFYGMKRGTEFHGLATYPKYKNMKPYDKPKTYYITQPQMEILVMEDTNSVLFISSTCAAGTPVWEIDCDSEYISTTLSIIKYMYNNFVKKGKRVPTDYFFSLPPTDPRYKIYKAYVERTVDMAKNARIYCYLEGDETMKTANKIGMGSDNSAYWNFPRMPEYVPAWQRAYFYARRLLTNWSLLKWATSMFDYDARLNNLCVISCNDLLFFTRDVVEAIVTNHIGKTGEVVVSILGTPDAAEKNPYKQAAFTFAEKYQADMLKLAFEMFGEPVFGATVDGKVFVRMLCKSAVEEFRAFKRKFGDALISDEQVTDDEDDGEGPNGDYNSRGLFNMSKHRYVFQKKWPVDVGQYCLKVMEQLYGTTTTVPDDTYKFKSLSLHAKLVMNSAFFVRNKKTKHDDVQPEMFQYANTLATVFMLRLYNEVFLLQMQQKK